MQVLSILPHASSPVQAELLCTTWRQECADLPAVQALTPATEARLVTVLQHMLADTGDINVDHHDVWEALTDARALQFSMATSSDLNRAQIVGPQLWAASTVLGDVALPARQIVLAIQSGTALELEMDELTQLLEDVVRRTGQEAEVVFGHGLNPALGDGIQVMMLVSRY